jgi:amphi-Trp domain-containing protein
MLEVCPRSVAADHRCFRVKFDLAVERDCTPAQFVDTLRRLADAIEQGESFRIQVVDSRFTVPADAQLSIEHEASDGEEELELQLRWKQ